MMMLKRSWLRRFLIISMLVSLVTLLFPGIAFAQGGEEMPDFAMAINTVWVLISGFLVFFMQAGFGFLEAGFIRAKNVGNILMENFIDTAITGLTFWAVGFAIMFGVGNGVFGQTYFFLRDIPETFVGIPTLAFFFFQFAFSAAASTIASGAMSERTEFKSDLIYSVVVSALIYPIVGHWIWSGDGWLAGIGFADFAGSTVVHSVGAWAGLMGTLFLGPRLGKSFKEATGIPGHSMALAALGTFILWLGWFGFNPGSTISGMAVNDIALITVNTNLAACAGIFVAVFLGWWQSGVPQLPWAFNGGLAGLVAITAPCAWVTPAESILIGAIGGAVMYAGVLILERFKIDDPVGAIGVHGFGGVWGTLSVGLFANSGDLVGVFHGGGLSLLGVQLVGVVAVFAFVTVSAGVLFYILKATLGLRVEPQGEMFGLDVYEHGIVTYPEFMNAFSVPSEPKPGSPHAEPHTPEVVVPSSSPAAGD
jgi:Amt family ammonium transporter